jgi:PAS domain S-box-containing protein
MSDSPDLFAARVVVVHDDSRVASALAARLTELGFVIAGAVASSAEAERIFRGTRVDLLLMQLDPAARHADEIRRALPMPVVFLVAPADEATLRSGGLPGPFGYVVQPYAARELRMNIDMALVSETVKTSTYAIEERFFAVSIDLLCCLDFNGYFKRLNPAWERTLGFTRTELMSKPFIEFVHPEDRARTLAQNRAVRSGGQALGFENRYLCKDGSYRWFLWNAAPDADHRVIYSVARDITERKHAEQERERMLVELQTALAEVRTLQEILPICAYCKKIRDDENYWQSVEAYISHHTNATFSHGICPSCYESEVEPQFRRRPAD